MTANVTVCCNYACLTREAEVAFEMALRLSNRREGIHAFNNFDHAFLAFALLAAGRGHIDAHGFSVIE
jgi:hypothetical protein